jgi:RHS repeat-associated protein
MTGTSVVIFLVMSVVVCVAAVLRPLGGTSRWRPARLRTRLLIGAAVFLILLPAVTPAFPRPGLPWLVPNVANAGEILASPEFVDATVLPDGQAGLIFVNDLGGGVAETRFKSYFAEYGLNPSQQLSTSSAWYPQLLTFQGKVVAAYVDNRIGSPTFERLLFRTSLDSGASWGSEFVPFGAETFNAQRESPVLVASRDGTRVYLFSCCVGQLPQYRYTTDANLLTWTAPAAAGDASMHLVHASDCSTGGSWHIYECERSRNFDFTETATAGQWIYVARADSGFTNGSRGTQVGPLGGPWSAQVDHGGTGGLNCCGHGNASVFLDRGGAVYFIRVAPFGESLYLRKSVDGGFTWTGTIDAYTPLVANYTVGSPVGLYVPGYSRGEYIWYAGFGGDNENTVRVIPLWSQSLPYSDTGTARLFGSHGGDFDFGTAYPYTFGRRDIPTGVGAYKTSAEDLALPGRLLNFSFTRSYTSADIGIGPFGPGWTHSFNWSLAENGALVDIRRGDGRRDQFVRNPDLTYTPPSNVFDVLTKNGDSSFTLKLKNQTRYEFSSAGKLTRIHEPAGNQLTLGYGGGKLTSVTDSVGRVVVLGYTSGTNIARGRTYTTVPPASWNTDTGLVELTDGNVGVTGWATAWQDASWQQHEGHPLVDFTIDLGAIQPLGVARSYYYEGLNFGIPKPASVEILTSTDNVAYTSRGTTPAASAINQAISLWRYDLALSASARYVRFHVVSGGGNVFTGEAEVFMAGFTPPVAQAGTNVGASRPYTKSVPATAPYFDDPSGSPAELTNGTVGSSSAYTDGAWQGHQNLGATPLDVTIDLGTVQAVGVTRSFHYHHPVDGVIKPSRIELLTSIDGSGYTSRGATTATAALNDEGSRWRYEFDVGGVGARYVRFRLTAGGTWLFSSEMQVFAEGAGPVSVPAAYGERLTAIQDSSGRRVTYSYDQNGRLTGVVDKLGNAAGQTPILHKWHYAYDAHSQRIASVIDPDGRTRVTNTYNDEGRLATQKDGVGNTSIFTYGNQITMVTDPRGHLTTQLFDPRWRLESQTDVVNLETFLLQYFYEDAWENLTRTIDRNGNETIFEYDSQGNVTKKIDPPVAPDPGTETVYEYDTSNNLKRIIDAPGFETFNTYNAVTNVKESTRQQITILPTPTYALTKWEYTDGANPGLPTKIISPRGNTDPLVPNYTYSQALTYDAQGNLIQRIDADNNKTTFGYDGVGRQTTMVDPDGYFPVVDPANHTWTTVYDENDRTKEVKDPLNHSAFAGYDGAGNRTTATDRNGNVTTYAYDGAARLSTVKQKPDPIGQPALEYTTSVLRDGNGNATQVTQGNGVVTDYGYDDINRLTSFTTHPSVAIPNLTTSYKLDGNGNVEERTAGDGVITTYTYDALNRLSTVSAPGLSTITYTYDELSRRETMTDVTGVSTYTYDGLGRLTTAVQPNGTLGYGYDLDSNRTTLTYPTVGNVTYVFSPAGRLSNLTDWGSRQSTYTYSAAGLAKTVSVPGGMTTSYGYDNAQRLTSLVNSTGAGTVTSHIYTLDNEGNRTAIDELMPNGAPASVKVNSDAGTTVQDHPDIGLGADLASYLIWDDARDGNANIYFDRRDPLTGLWQTTDVKVNTDTGTRIQLNPVLSLDSASNAYAVWQDERNGAGKPDIYYSKRTCAPTCAWLTPNLKVNDDAGGGGGAIQRNPTIASKDDGDTTAAWVDLRSNQTNIWSATLTDGTGSWSANKRVTDNTSALKDFPDLAMDSAGVSYAVWQDRRSGNDDIFFSTLAAGGAAWAANLKISDDGGTAHQTKPRIGVDAAGNLTAAWIDGRTSPARVRAARRPAAGTWSASTEISPSPANVQSLALSVRPDGFAWAVWGDTRAGATNQDVWGSRYDPNLNLWSAPVRLDDDPGTTANQLSPTVATGPAETMLSWRDNRLSANGDTQARRVLFMAGMTDHFALGYDGLNRLKSVSGPVSESFALDGASNITNRSGTVETYDQANRLEQDGSIDLTWSNADRLDQRGSDIFSYDALDRMTSSTVAGTARTYSYNGDGLVQTRSGGVAASFLWDAATAPSRLFKQNSDNIIYGLGPLYVVKADATTLTFARDGSKNVRAEVNGAGATTGAFRYRSYGQIAQNTATGPSYLGFAAATLDTSGLYYMQARWYDSAFGRFMSRDPEAGDLSLPRTLNLYSYAGANPIMLSDPTGRCFVLCGAVIGLVAYSATKFIEARLNNSKDPFGTWDLREAAIATAAGAATQGVSAVAGLAARTALIGGIGATSSIVNDVTAGREPNMAKGYVDAAASMASSFIPGGSATVTAVLVGVPTNVGFGLVTDWIKEQIDEIEKLFLSPDGSVITP